jgi:hypothetical protein
MIAGNCLILILFFLIATPKRFVKRSLKNTSDSCVEMEGRWIAANRRYGKFGIVILQKKLPYYNIMFYVRHNTLILGSCINSRLSLLSKFWEGGRSNSAGGTQCAILCFLDGINTSRVLTTMQHDRLGSR